jgi:eukaryotic-like serine/threonine-protein kinase
MDLKPGRRLGPYEIVSRIGAGGMGEVFRARDTRLERSVAVKVLPSEFAANAALKVRFEREARAISQLNHPHICTLHDVGSEDGVEYLVMELIEGETLADRLGRGPLPLADVLKFGAQIAEGLEAAHRAGIVHRDLKPGNIMLTRAGAKLLDFGLAKTVVAPVEMNAPTVAKPLTQEGTILGTFQYMAPEQLEGEEADPRTDIFALGCVLYEMLTGRRAFQGKTKTSLIAAIVGAEPTPVSQLVPLTPPALEHVVRRCLAKERDERWQSAHDVAAELRWVSETASHPAVAAPVHRVRKNRERLLWAAALVLAVAATAALVPRLRREQPPPSYHFTIPTRDAGYTHATWPLLSPDGQKVVFYARREDGTSWLFARRLDSFSFTPLMPVEPPYGEVFWSPDSRQVALRALTKLWRVDVDGGQPQLITDAPSTRNGAWAPDGTILLGQIEGPLLQTSVRGTAPVPVTKLDTSRFERGHHAPVFLPNGKDFLFVTYARNPANINAPHTLYAGRLGSPEIRRIGEITSRVRYARGHLFYVRGSALLAVPFDVGKLEISGEPVAIAEDVRYFFPTSLAAFSVAEDGTVAWLPRARADQLVIADVSGKVVRTLAANDDFSYVMTVTPDGTRAVLARRDPAAGTYDLWMHGLDRPGATRVTFNGADASYPVLSADGTKLYYGSDRSGVPDLYVKQVHGTEEDRVILQEKGEQRATDVSRDGRYLLYGTVAGQVGSDIYALSVAEGKSFPLVRTPADERGGRLSPDGRFVVYESDTSGREEVYLVPFLRPGAPRQLSSGGGRWPKWSHDGRTIYFMSGEYSIGRVAFDGDTAGEPEVVFTSPQELGNFEPLPGGRFLLIVIDQEAQLKPARVIVRWPDTVGRR